MVNATALIPFVPSGPDFEQALAFFAELGFAATWRNGGLAGLRFGGEAFMLQDIDVPEWQKPTDFPWGREVNIIDPAGVCWHVRQARTD